MALRVVSRECRNNLGLVFQVGSVSAEYKWAFCDPEMEAISPIVNVFMRFRDSTVWRYEGADLSGRLAFFISQRQGEVDRSDWLNGGAVEHATKVPKSCLKCCICF